MRFFKYLILVLLSCLSSHLYAVQKCTYTVSSDGSVHDNISSACDRIYSKTGYKKTDFDCKLASDNRSISLYIPNSSASVGSYGYATCKDVPAECPDVGYPINVIQSADSPIEQIRCVPLSGTNQFCVAKKNNYPILNSASGENMISYVMENTSKTPVSNCTPLKEGQCNNKDPYGGCFKVPDDGCTRTQNGSIICPNNDTPNVQNNCTGTYCERPPTGCPTGYVSGSFNGKALCVKSSPSNGSGNGSGSGDGDGSGSGTGNGNGSGNGDGSGSGNGNGSGSGSGSNSSTSSSTSTSTSTSTSSNGSGGSTTVNVTNNNTNNTTVNVDVSGVISAINNMKSTLADFLNDVNTSVKQVTTTLNGTNQKIDATISKLDSVNTTLNSINQNGKDTNAKLDKLIAKNGNGHGTGTDLTATNEKLDKINDKLQKTNDFLTAEPPTDGNTSIPTRELTEQNFATNLITVNAGYCPADKHIDWSTPFGHVNKNISFQSVCDQTAWFGYLVLCLCYYAAAMIVVRA